MQWLEGDGVYVATDRELRRYDLDSGDAVWSVRADQIGVGEAGIFVLVGDELRSLDSEDGETEWSADVDLGDGDSNGLLVAVADDFVAVGGPEAVAFGAEDGDQLWSASAEGGGSSLMLFGRGEVAVLPTDSYGGEGELELEIYDRDGSTGSVETQDFFYVVPFRSGGEDYAFSFGDGTLYRDHQALETYEGAATLTGEGVYTLNDGEVSYYDYGDSTPRWTIDGFSDETNMQTGDGRFLVVDGDRLMSYS